MSVYDCPFVDLQSSIRDLYLSQNESLNSSDDYFFSIISALDVLHDADLAIKSFFDESWNDSSKYLAIYGLFNAMYIQHEAVDTLYNRLVSKDIKSVCKTIDDEKFKLLRELRNGLAAHTSCANGGKAYFINRSLTSTHSVVFNEFNPRFCNVLTNATNDYRKNISIQFETLAEVNIQHIKPLLDEIKRTLEQKSPTAVKPWG